MAFFGSPIHPRGMGPLIRFCLHYGVKLWFIPPSEPWWNGIVEKFNDHYEQKFFDKVPMASLTQLRQESLAFEHWHNSTYRYSKLKGKNALQPKALDAPVLGIAVNMAASVINAVWGWQLVKIGPRERSPALDADGRYVMADAIASTGVVAGVGATVLTGWLQLDALVAGAVGVYILFSGWQLVRDSVGGLMDEAAAPETIETINACIAQAAKGAIEAHDLRTRHAGPVTFIQFHLIVPGSMTVAAAHDICDRIENTLQEKVQGARVAIHIEPEHKAKREGILVGPGRRGIRRGRGRNSLPHKGCNTTMRTGREHTLPKRSHFAPKVEKFAPYCKDLV